MVMDRIINDPAARARYMEARKKRAADTPAPKRMTIDDLADAERKRHAREITEAQFEETIARVIAPGLSPAHLAHARRRLRSMERDTTHARLLADAKRRAIEDEAARREYKDWHARQTQADLNRIAAAVEAGAETLDDVPGLGDPVDIELPSAEAAVPATAQEQIDTIMADAAHPYHRGDEAAVAHVSQLFEAVYPTSEKE